MAQNFNDNRVEFLSIIDSCTFVLKDQYLLYSSLQVFIDGNKIEPSNYSINGNVFLLSEVSCSNNKGRNIKIFYRKLSIDIGKRYALLDTADLKKRDIAIYIGYDLTPDVLSKSNRIIDSKTLDYNGSFSRGFSVGNAQSLVVNSKFDMQLQGEIGDGIKISAAISDENIPIQAEGNTQVLQEFDKVFIELSKGSTSVIAGDYVALRPNSYFVNYLKKLQGIGLRNIYDTKQSKVTTSANVATSRGKFARQSIANKEGNQGPYKLNGNNNERYIIILSGTEKIYFNGELLKRGQEYDYAIDYNTSEIIFSPNRLISRETRIIAEFEYTDQNYYRTLYTASSQFDYKKSSITFNYYSEQDSKKSLGQIDLDSNAIEVLKNVGDNTSGYNVSSIRQAMNDDKTSIKYELIQNPNFPIDTNEFYLKFSTDENKLLYTSFFTEVGLGKGSYAIDPAVSLNGRVYKFVGVNQGSYDPINKLLPPEQKQMMDVSYQLAFGKYGKIYTDLSLSNYDRNRFSSVSDGDNIGLAAYLSFENGKTIKRKRDSLDFIYGLSFEQTGSDFKPLNQYRNAEFLRDWNYLPTKPNNEKIYRAKIGLSSPKSNFTTFFNRFDAGTDLKGNNIGLDFSYHYKGFKIIGLPSATFTETAFLKSNFIRPNLKVSQTFKSLSNMVVGFDLESERNLKNKTNQPLIDSSSYAFYYAKSYIGFGENEDLGLRLSYNKRQDNFATNTTLKKALDIQEFELAGKWQGSEVSSFNTSLKLRDYRVVDQALAKNEKSKLTLLGSIDHSMSIVRKSISTTTNYIVNSGQEPKLEFVYQKVENLRGDYVYVGSDTAKIKNINDFRYDPSNPLASYVKFILPNNEFSTTNNIALNHALRIEPSRYWANDTTKRTQIQKIINMLTNTTLARISNKSASGSNEFNYFNFNAADSSLVSYTKSIVATTMFNRGNPKYDLSYIYKNNGNKNNQINGFETRLLKENEWKVRASIIKNTDFFISYVDGFKTFENKLFLERNFLINVKRYNAELSYRPSTKMRVNAKYANILNSQSINLREQAKKNEYTITFNWRSSNTSALDLSFSFIDVEYLGDKNSLIQYDILESLQPGSNYLWSINYTRRISKFIDLVFSYDGRKTGASEIINVGRMQAKASF
jgi:hypothetical protein